MLDTVMSYIANGLMIVTSLFLFVFLVGRLFPTLLLTPRQSTGLLCDRGLKKYTFPEGRAIVYEPSIKYRKYLPQYILFSHTGSKFIKCKLDYSITSLCYEIVAFNNKNEIIGATSVSEPIDGKRGYTKPVKLPGETSYVALRLLTVNGVRLKNEPCFELPIKKVGIFATLTVIATVIEAFVVRSVLLFIADNSLNYSARVGDSGAFTLLSAILIGLVCAGLTLLAYKKADTRISKN